jgi:hypothetical protein
MAELVEVKGNWTLLTFTDDPSVLAALADLHGRTGNVRLVAILPAPMQGGGDLLTLVDEAGRLARELGVSGHLSVMLDGRGTVTQSWNRLPEAEALSLYDSRPALPSSVPPWLFPVLAAAVLIAGAAAWAWSQRPPTGAPLSAPTMAASAPATPLEVPSAAEEDEGDGEEAEADGVQAADGTTTPGPGAKQRKAGRASNQVLGWAITPRDKAATIAVDDAGALRLSALPDARVSACRALTPLAGAVAVSAEWKLTGFTDKPVRVMMRMNDSAGKPLKGATARALVGRGKGTADWKPVAATITASPGATQGRLCLDLDAGPGQVWIRNVAP